jgi:hypothetical protein
VTQLDTRARATALRLINKYGRTVVLKRAGASVYNETTRVNVPTETNYTVKAVEDSPSRTDIARGVLANSSIFLIAAAALPVEPTPTDTIVDGTKTWTVGMVTYDSSGEQKALWRIEVKA